MEVKAVMVILIQKLRDTQDDVPIAKNKIITRQLQRVQKLLEKMQNWSEDGDDSDKCQKSRDYICLFNELEDEIEKFSFRVARQRQRSGFSMSGLVFYNKLNSCRILIRKLNNFISKIYCFDENLMAAATPRNSSISSSTIWPTPTIPSPIRGPLTRSSTTISYPHQQKKNLTHSVSFNNNHVLQNVHDFRSSYEVVAKDYNNLRDDLKPCVLYMAHYPKDFKIPVRRLLRLWLAEGFVERKPSPEDIVQKHFDDLVDHGIIEITKFRSDNNPKQCRLNPTFHDYLSLKAQEIGLFYNHHDSDHLEDVAGPFGVRRMIHQMGPATDARTKSVRADKFDPCLLRSYMSFNPQLKDMPAKEVGPILGRILKSDFRLLRVLDLEGVYKPTLPNNLDHLYLLKYLGLRRTNLDHLPESVGKLSYLETLDLKHTYIDSLPNSIWQNKHLRHLNLNNIRLTMPPGSSSTLVTLWGLVLDDRASVDEVLGTLLNLRELGIKFNLSKGNQLVLFDCIAKQSDLQSLRLFSVDGSDALKLYFRSLATLTKLTNLNLFGILKKLPSANEFPPTIKVLTLSISQLNNDPMETLGQLPCLIVLRLLGDSFVGKRMVCHQGGFKKLAVLKIWKLKELEEWDVDDEAMKNLIELDIRSCYKLKYVPSRLLIKPRRLQRLILTDMPNDFVDRTEKIKSLLSSRN